MNNTHFSVHVFPSLRKVMKLILYFILFCVYVCVIAMLLFLFGVSCFVHAGNEDCKYSLSHGHGNRSEILTCTCLWAPLSWVLKIPGGVIARFHAYLTCWCPFALQLQRYNIVAADVYTQCASTTFHCKYVDVYQYKLKLHARFMNRERAKKIKWTAIRLAIITLLPTDNIILQHF